LNPAVLDGFAIELSLQEVLRRLSMREERAKALGTNEILRIAMSLVHPRALYTTPYITSHGSDTLEIEGVKFTSRILAKNVEKTERVFPYVLTIGDALESRASSYEMVAKQLILNAMGDVALGSSLNYLQRHISQQYALGTLSEMGPGQLDWPMSEQRQLFSILGDVETTVGVKLTQSMMMVPRKSISGMIFPTEVTFTSCQLCQRKNCPSRKASYDKGLNRKYT
jgi:hypothetical protein